MNSLKYILLRGAALMTALLVLQTSTFAADVPRNGVGMPQQSVSQSTATEHGKQCGPPEMGCNRCMCVDQKVTPQQAADVMEHEKKCKKYVRTHYGPPSKGFGRVEVVYVECPQ